MLKSAVISHFGSAAAVARALGLTRGAVWQWPEIVPRSSAYHIEVVTGGQLRVDPSVYATNPQRRPDEAA
jgi:DNA-binding transcriptional regulator YdaS (Cro superfamily)